jgi:two-component system response regulator AtoC
LENVLERAAILAGNQEILLQHLPADIAGISASTPTYTIDESNYSIPKATEQLERKLIEEALKKCQGNKAKTAKLLEISERSLWYKLEAYHLK